MINNCKLCIKYCIFIVNVLYVCIYIINICMCVHVYFYGAMTVLINLLNTNN